MRKALLLPAIFGILLMPLAAQVAAPPQPQPSRTIPAGQPAIPAPVSFSPLLSQLEQVAMGTNGDVARLRIDKWKTDSGSKRQSQDNAESIQRNLTDALPGMIAAVRSNPDNLATGFSLYRNVNALYDVLSSLAESTGAFGPKDDYQALAADANNLDQIRRRMADQIEKLANYKDAEVSRLMVQVRNLAAQAAAAPPTKIIVDDNEPPKKPVRKKKAPAKPAPKPEQQTTPPPQ